MQELRVGWFDHMDQDAAQIKPLLGSTGTSWQPSGPPSSGPVASSTWIPYTALLVKTPLLIVLARVFCNRILISTYAACSNSCSTFPATPLSLFQRESKFAPSVCLVCNWGKQALWEWCGGPSGNHSSPVSPGTLCHCQTLSYGKQMRITDFP